MTDTARVLLTVAVLSASAMATVAWRVTRLDFEDPARLIGELRLMQWAGIVLAGVSGIPIGLALGVPGAPIAHLDVAAAVMFVGLAGFVLQQDPREGLLLACAGFFAHALIDVAHRPGLLSPDLAPRWYSIGCAIHNVVFAGLCFWIRRR